MSNLAIAYAMRKRNQSMAGTKMNGMSENQMEDGMMAHGGQVNPKLDESKKGEVCPYCNGGGIKMAEGGFVDEGMTQPHSDTALDEDEESSMFDHENSMDDHLDNEKSDPDSKLMSEEEDERKKSMKGGRLLSKVLGAIRQRNS